VLVDLGTGDGRYVLATAAREPDSLVIGIDPAVASMERTSRRAGRRTRRRGPGNVLFVMAAAEALPAELAGVADAVTVHMPWGSLLAGILAGEGPVVSGIARLTRPGGTVTVLVSVTAHDRVGARAQFDAREIARLAARYPDAGLKLEDARAATDAEIRASHSSWAKRLSRGSRTYWRLRFRRGREPA
jgi:16S rRNA (adenine(1408)-N(1))-methyltransferase